MKPKHSGFSLVELMIALSIAVVLMATVTPGLRHSAAKICHPRPCRRCLKHPSVTYSKDMRSLWMGMMIEQPCQTTRRTSYLSRLDIYRSTSDISIIGVEGLTSVWQPKVLISTSGRQTSRHYVRTVCLLPRLSWIP